jgi:hypothetical protein
MARIKNGILGGVSGKIGNVVGGSWNGIDYLRTLQSDVKQPNTELQSTQRLKFKTVIRFLQPLNEVIRIGFKAWTVKMSAFNAAFSYNFHSALIGDYNNGFAMDHPYVLLSRGNLNGAMNLTVVTDGPAAIHFTWTDNSAQGNAKTTDSAFYAVVNPAKQETVYLLNAANRLTGEIVASLPVNWSGDTVHCYFGFFALNALLGGGDKRSVSNSQYAGSLLVE